MDVDTSTCQFLTTPSYYVSVAGATNHWILAGFTSIYSPSTTSFRIYAQAWDGTSSATLLSYAASYTWDINWVGLTY